MGMGSNIDTATSSQGVSSGGASAPSYQQQSVVSGGQQIATSNYQNQGHNYGNQGMVGGY